MKNAYGITKVLCAPQFPAVWYINALSWDYPNRHAQAVLKFTNVSTIFNRFFEVLLRVDTARVL
jgi:hypothetical protein